MYCTAANNSKERNRITKTTEFKADKEIMLHNGI
jgi:hypothetical protein